MSCVLLYSPRCNKCQEIIKYIESVPQFKSVCRYHNINRYGIPHQYSSKIKFVPTLITKDGKFFVGYEIKNWLNSLLPVEEITNLCINGSCGLTNIDGTEDESDIFELNDYGRTLQPAMTKELQDRIAKNVTEGFNNLKR